MDLIEYNKRINEIADIIIQSVQKEVTDYDEVERQVIGAFTFGAINAFSLQEKMQAVQIQGGTISILIEKFNYSVNAATQFCDFLIRCTDKSFHPTMNTIIHKGIDGYQIINNQKELGSNIKKMIDIIKRATN